MAGRDDVNVEAVVRYVTLSTKDSREQAGRWIKAIYYAAG